MTIEEIKRNAPVGATHYFNKLDYIAYYKFDDKFSFWSKFFNVWVDFKRLLFSKGVTIDDLKPL